MKANLSFAFLLSVAPLAAQSMPTPSLPPPGAAAEDPIVLSPFEVATTSDVGYQARETLSGSRLNTSLKDVSSQVQVMTAEFLQDLGITDLNDAMTYSMATETAAEIFDVSATNLAGNEGSIQAFAGAARTRGLGGTVIGRDFFQTQIPVDAYNTERFTFAPGATNTLFGNASPAGSVDSSTKRARVHRRTLSVSLRVDDRGSARTVVDLNQPIIPKIAAVRWVALRDRQNEWREPSFADQNRSFVAFIFTPSSRFSFRAWYEHYDAHNQPVRNTLLRDRVTPWIAAGRPAFDNSLPLTGIVASPARPWIRTPTTRTNPYYVINAGAGAGVVRLINPTATTFGTVQTVGQAQLGTPPNNFDWSMTDESVAPIDIAFAGNAVQNRRRGRNHGAVLNLNPVPNLFVELGQSHEIFKHRYVDLFRFSELNLYADANRWALDQAGALRRDAAGALVPNPYFGRYYIEDVFVAAGNNLMAYDQQRASVAYQLDFTTRRDWRRWLGRHNFTGLYDRLLQDNAGSGQRHDPRLVSPAAGGPGATATNLFFRYYLPDAQNPGPAAVSLPFDPLQAGNFDLPGTGGARLLGYDSPQGADAANFPSRRTIHSRSFALQSFLWSERIVLNFSRRTNSMVAQNISGITAATWPRTAGGGFEYLDKIWESHLRYAARQESTKASKTKDNKGVVVHPFRWLSLRYTELANAQVTGLTRYAYDGSEIEIGTGSGREYGFSLRTPDGRLALSLNKYQSTLLGIQGSTLGGVNNIAQAVNGGGGNSIRDDLPALEQAALRAGAPLDPKWRHFQDLLLTIPFATTENPASFDPPHISGSGLVRDQYDFIVDRESKGYELNLIGNPTPEWRVSVSGARNQSMEADLAPQYFAFIADRLPVWARYLDAPTWRSAGNAPSPTNQTLGQLLQASIANFYFIQRSAGQPNVMDRKYRVTATSSYRFTRSWLKGSRLGATYVWRSPAAVAFRQLDVTDNPFLVPGLSTRALTVSDPQNPVRGGPLTSFDFFAGYTRRLFRQRVTWDVQLNIRNVLDRNELLVQRALTDGQPAVFMLQAPRAFILTNTFSF